MFTGRPLTSAKFPEDSDRDYTLLCDEPISLLGRLAMAATAEQEAGALRRESAMRWTMRSINPAATTSVRLRWQGTLPIRCHDAE